MMRCMTVDASSPNRMKPADGRPQQVAARRADFRAMHEDGFFVLPNPWDQGGVRRLERLGFRALASTSAGYAWSLGVDDRELTLDQVLAHLSELCGATNLPVNADFEHGYAEAPEQVAANVRRASATGLAGLSIEDMGAAGLYDLPLATERMRAAREALDSVDPNIVLVGRSEGQLISRDDFTDTIERLSAYAEAGADCLYAPGITTDEQIRTVVEAVAPKAVNVLFRSSEMTAERLAALGVRRASSGSLLATAAWRASDVAATRLVTDGSLPAELFVWER